MKLLFIFIVELAHKPINRHLKRAIYQNWSNNETFPDSGINTPESE